MIKEFKQKLISRNALGTFMKTSDPAFVEAAGYAGYDFVVLDMEHGPTNITQMQNNIRAAQISGAAPIIRVSTLNNTLISQALDIGAVGVQIPQITCKEDAELAVKSSKFYPLGERGVCGNVRAAKYSLIKKEDYFKRSNETLVIIMIEGRKALDNIDEILEVPNIDVIFIGPYDLSQSLEIPGQVNDQKVINTMRDIISKAQSKNIMTGTFTDNYKMLSIWKDVGVQYLTYGTDVGTFFEAAQKIKKHFI